VHSVVDPDCVDAGHRSPFETRDAVYYRVALPSARPGSAVAAVTRP
jgi:hypothetical protein